SWLTDNPKEGSSKWSFSRVEEGKIGGVTLVRTNTPTSRLRLDERFSARRPMYVPRLNFRSRAAPYVSKCGAESEPTTDTGIKERKCWTNPANCAGSSRKLSSRLTPPSERV